MNAVRRVGLPVGALATVSALGIVAPAQAWALATRLAPVLLFVAAMSVVVNLSAQAGVFDAVAAWSSHRSGRTLSASAATWCQIVALALSATVFLSLDTTAILVTPLALAMAQRAGLSLPAVALTVIWIANVGSLALPVSNLTNLLAIESAVFDGSTGYLAAAWRPAVVAIGVAVAAATVAAVVGTRRSSGRIVVDDDVPATRTGGHDPSLRAGLITLGLLMPLLASPFPYWASATGAAAVLWCVSKRSPDTDGGTAPLIPWSSLCGITALCAIAALAHTAGALDWISAGLASREHSTGGLLAVAGAGAAASNLVNNLPAFLALEEGVHTPAGLLALLVGVNAGSIVTPWASLATLLWHDQVRRCGARVRWSRFIALGCLLAPIAVTLPTLAIG